MSMDQLFLKETENKTDNHIRIEYQNYNGGGTIMLAQTHTDGYFEVLCAEGKVKVTHQEETYFLTKGLSFNTIDQQINEFEPTQFGNTSSVYYSKVPLNHVIHLIENLYNLNIELQSNKSFY